MKLLVSFGEKSNFLTSQGLREVTTRANIGVKRMGELDSKPFLTTMKRKVSKVEVQQKALELCSQWEDYLRDPSWHPFKVKVDENGNAKVCLYVIISVNMQFACLNFCSLLPSFSLLYHGAVVTLEYRP